MTGQGPSRRLVLGLLPVPFLFGLGLGRAPSDDALRDVLAGVFRYTESAREVGRRYLALHPGEADAGALLGHLRTGLDLESWAAGGAERVALGAAIRAASRRDFRAGRLTRIAGCTMPVTELRLCALVALRRAT